LQALEGKQACKPACTPPGHTYPIGHSSDIPVLSQKKPAGIIQPVIIEGRKTNKRRISSIVSSHNGGFLLDVFEEMAHGN